MPGGEPFFKKGTKDTACLLVHGFTSTPQTLRELSSILNQNGFSCFAPLLPGHGTAVHDLNYKTWFELEQAVEIELLKLSRQYRKIVLIGESSGGTIVARLSAHYPDKVAGLVTVGGAFLFPLDKVMRTLLPIYKYVQPTQPKVRVADVFDRTALQKRVAYREVPMHAFHRLLNYTRLAVKDLSKVVAPILIMHARQDHTVSPRSVHLLKDRVSSNYKKVIWYTKSYHNLLIDIEKQKVFKDINKFVRRVDTRFASPQSIKEKKDLGLSENFAIRPQ